MFENIGIQNLAAIAGLLGGMVLGFAARWGRFCTLGAIEDVFFGRNTTRMRMWLFAIGLSAFVIHSITSFGLIAPEDSFYLLNPTTILANAIGGILFGIGMALVGTCGYGMLARLGGGDLKSLVTFFVMGISAYATLRGLMAYLRIAIFPSGSPADSPAGFTYLFSDWFGFSAPIIGLILAIVLMILSLIGSSLLKDARKIIAATLVGLAVAWGYYATGHLLVDEFDPIPIESYTFTAPLGKTLIFLMTTTGSSLNFGIGATLGVIAGAALTSLFQNHFRWEACDDAREMRRQILGGFLMGVGGVTALGCTIGQGISAAALFAYSAPLSLAGIFLGAWLGLQYLISDLPLLKMAKNSK